jgi:hypothetical protein
VSGKDGKRMLIMKETLRRNKCKFIKFVLIIYDNLIITVITLSEKMGGIIFPAPFLSNSGSR